MECLIGIKGRDFVLMATDCVAGRSIIAMKKGVQLHCSVLLVMFMMTDEVAMIMIPTRILGSDET